MVTGGLGNVSKAGVLEITEQRQGFYLLVFDFQALILPDSKLMLLIQLKMKIAGSFLSLKS